MTRLFRRVKRGVFLSTVLLVCTAGASYAGDADRFDAGLAEFKAKVGSRHLDYSVESIFVLPKQTVEVRVLTYGAKAHFTAEGGRTSQQARGYWTWTAPDRPGLVQATLKSGKRTIALQWFVLCPYPARNEGRIGRFQVGRYPDAADPRAFPRPRGFVRVGPEELNLAVSPHFRLGQFVCKQNGPKTTYLLLDVRLVHKLERLLSALNESGYPCSTLAVLSGFRTPAYNQRLGNARFSSHLWGLAADVYVDEDRNGMQDDLNRDGRCDLADAAIVHDLAAALDAEPSAPEQVGGLGLYGPNSVHGPFVHMDVRGRRASWGARPRTLTAAAAGQTALRSPALAGPITASLELTDTSTESGRPPVRWTRPSHELALSLTRKLPLISH